KKQTVSRNQRLATPAGSFLNMTLSLGHDAKTSLSKRCIPTAQTEHSRMKHPRHWTRTAARAPRLSIAHSQPIATPRRFGLFKLLTEGYIQKLRPCSTPLHHRRHQAPGANLMRGAF